MIEFYGVTYGETALLLVAFCLAGVTAIFGSSITLSFYWGKKKIVPVLYRIMAITDMLTGLNAIYFVILCLTYLKDCETSYYTARKVRCEKRTEKIWIAFNNGAAGCHRDSTFLIPSSFVITAVVTRLPLFIGVVLSVVRTINIRSPFFQVHKPAVAISIACWGLLWSVLAITSTQSNMEFTDHNDDGRTKTACVNPISNETVQLFIKDNFWRLLVNNPAPVRFGRLQTWFYMIVLMVSFLIPIVIMVISTVAQLFFLYRDKIGGNTAQMTQMTVTIIQITALAVVCALPSFFYIADGWWWNVPCSGSDDETDNTQAFVYGFGLPVLNSALNPVLLINRSSALREHLAKLARGEFKEIGNKKPTSAATTSTATRAQSTATASTASRAQARAPRNINKSNFAVNSRADMSKK